MRKLFVLLALPLLVVVPEPAHANRTKPIWWLVEKLTKKGSAARVVRRTRPAGETAAGTFTNQAAKSAGTVVPPAAAGVAACRSLAPGSKIKVGDTEIVCGK